MPTTEQTIRNVVEEVLAELGKNRDRGTALRRQPSTNGIPVMTATNGHQPRANGHQSGGPDGVFSCVDGAVAAAKDAFGQLQRKSIADRNRIVQIVKEMCEQQADELGRMELEETKIGRLDHKIEKLKIIKLVPGAEWLKPTPAAAITGLTLRGDTPRSV